MTQTDTQKFLSPKIYPIIIYPYHQSSSNDNIKALYDELIDYFYRRNKDHDYQTDALGNRVPRKAYAKPITVLNYQTLHKGTEWSNSSQDQATFKACREIAEQYSDVIEVWSVDTCQTWLHGLGYAYNQHLSEEYASSDDVYWLIPADFNYSSPTGGEALDKLKMWGNKMMDVKRAPDLLLGEIATPPNSSKQLIDTYGTFGLLYNWFPNQAGKIREITNKPRTEFLALKHRLLEKVLQRRWFAYEQTLIILLLALNENHKIEKDDLGQITDSGKHRDILAGAIEQVERTERALKLYWREANKDEPNWINEFRQKDAQSEQIRGAALTILGEMLKGGAV